MLKSFPHWFTYHCLTNKMLFVYRFWDPLQSTGCDRQVWKSSPYKGIDQLNKVRETRKTYIIITDVFESSKIITCHISKQFTMKSLFGFIGAVFVLWSCIYVSVNCMCLCGDIVHVICFCGFQRHRLINETLQTELQSGVHALSIVVSYLS